MSKQRLYWFGLLAVLIQMLPVLLLGDGAYIRIHDTLEGELHWYHMLNLSGTGLSLSLDTVIPQIMNGLPRFTTHAPFQLTFWFMHLFGIYSGYLLNKLLLLIIAYVGMHRLISYLYPETSARVPVLMGVTYAWIPFYPVFGASFAGLPLMVYCVWKILDRSAKPLHYILLLIFPFYASIVWAAPSLLLVFFVLTCYRSYRSGFWLTPWLVQGLLVIAFLAANYFLLMSWIAPPEGFVSHREAYDIALFEPFELSGSIFATLYSIFLGHYHIGTFFTGLIWSVFLVASLKGKLSRTELLLAMSVLAISVFVGFYPLVIEWFAPYLSLVETFRFERIHLLLPMLYLLIFASGIRSLEVLAGWRRTLAFILVAQLLITVSLNDEFIHNMRHLTGFETKPNYKTYYDEPLMQDIMDYIGEEASTYRVVHLGINAAIGQHSGFHSLDALQSVYELEHKAAFARIIQPELDKSAVLDRYFTLWGNRCYLFSSELGREDEAFNISKDAGRVIKELDVNTAAIRAMGGRYVLSALPVENAASIEWQLLDTFSRPDSYWKIYLYKL